MQPGYPGSGQDPYNQPPSDPFGGPGYGQYPQQPDPYGQPQQQPPYQDPYAQPQQPPPYQDPYAQPQQPPQEYSVQQPTSGQPYDPYNPGGQPPYYQQPQSAPPAGYPQQPPAYQAPVVYPGGPGYGVPAAPSGTNTQALLSMIFGIVSIVLLCCFGAGVLFGGAALVLGYLGLNKVKNENAGGRGMAIAGLITGGIGALLSLIYLILIIIGSVSSP